MFSTVDGDVRQVDKRDGLGFKESRHGVLQFVCVGDRLTSRSITTHQRKARAS